MSAGHCDPLMGDDGDVVPRAHFEAVRQQRNTLLGALELVEARLARIEARLGLGWPAGPTISVAPETEVARILADVGRQVVAEACTEPRVESPRGRITADEHGLLARNKRSKFICEWCGKLYKFLGDVDLAPRAHARCLAALLRADGTCRDCELPVRKPISACRDTYVCQQVRISVRLPRILAAWREYRVAGVQGVLLDD